MPPSTTRLAPVMNDDSSDARNSAACASSSARPSRPMGMWTIRRARRSGSDNSSSSSGVWIGPGHKELARMPCQRVLDRDLACHREHAPLARGVGDLRGGGAHDRDERRDVDDGAPTRREHRGDAGLAAEPHALEVDLHHAFPRRFGRVERAAVVRGKDAGVVVEDVQATEGVHRGLHHRGAVVGPGHVRADERGLAPAARIVATTSCPSASLTSLTTTCAPSEANSSAAARPMPLAAPVISATFCASRPGIRPPRSCSRAGRRQLRPATHRVGTRRARAAARSRSYVR